MSKRKVDSLIALIHEKAVSVHMWAMVFKNQELDAIGSGEIGVQFL